MAQAAKEKGNAAFKVGDYPTAIGHYSVAIHHDRTDATFPLNRAAAYLKLGKNEDAERDCTAVLTLSKNNVKALFRRAQARAALGKLAEAHDDLTAAAALDPANQPVKEELARVVQLVQATKPKPKTDVVSPTSPAPKRRRVPITIVEPDGRRYPASDAASGSTSKSAAGSTPKTSAGSTPAPKTAAAEKTTLKTKPVVEGAEMNAVPSSPSAPAASKPPPPSTPASSSAQDTPPKPTENPKDPLKPKPASFKDAKTARESRVGGGIFRASGESVLFKREAAGTGKEETEQAAPSAPAESQPAPAVPEPEEDPEITLVKTVPMTLFEFTRAWERAAGAGEKWAVLEKIPPGAFPALFQTSLEPALFVEVVDALGVVLSSSSSVKMDAKKYMHAFARVPRFGTVVRFLSRAERARVRAVWGALGVSSGGTERGEGQGGEVCGRPAQLEEVWGAVWR
ncbi:hypothetical protein DFH07DRAFT_967957 [Mycena maculata]|uniref:RNA polymerase II-associated protein 3 n=1 Tax=Mycena maculata TaxID=230809 RepID=A0AAD7MUG4_9AGAR|nr:hypothetical protein DFH07DRAFT_967957 [Mycena maculata]